MTIMSNPETESHPPFTPMTLEDGVLHGHSGPLTSTSVPIRDRLKITITLFALFLTLFLAALDFTVATTAIPTITSSFNSAAGYTWIGSAYLLAGAASSPIWGRLSDIWGRKPILLSAVTLFSVGSVICAIAKNMATFLAGRSVQGAGFGGVVILVNICLSELFSMRDRGLFLGLTGVVWGLASGIGPLIGGAFAEYVSWRWNWWINLPCAGIAALFLCLFLQVHNPRTNLWEGMQAVDWIGSIGILGLSVMILLGLNLGGVFAPWTSPRVLSPLISGFVVTVMFGVYEVKYARNPLIPPRIVRQLSNNACLMVCFAHGFANVSSWYFLPLYFQSIRNLDPFHSGLLLIPATVTQAITGVVVGVMIQRKGIHLPFIYVGMALACLGFSLFTILSASTPLAVIVIFEVIVGLGIGMVFQAPLIALQSHTSDDDMATATALFGFIRNFSTSVSVIIGGVMFQNEMQKHYASLRIVLPPEIVDRFSGKMAAASVDLISTLSASDQVLVKDAYAQSLGKMWILYATTAGLGLLVSFAIKNQQLSENRVDVRTGVKAMNSDVPH